MIQTFIILVIKILKSSQLLVVFSSSISILKKQKTKTVITCGQQGTLSKSMSLTAPARQVPMCQEFSLLSQENPYMQLLTKYFMHGKRLVKGHNTLQSNFIIS